MASFRLRHVKLVHLIRRYLSIATSEAASALKLPKSKVELHVHLDACLRISTIIELAKQKKIALPSFQEDLLKPYISVSLEDSKQSSLTAFLQCFQVFLPVLVGDLDAIERVAFEFCEDQARSGVLYCEVRYSPHLMANKDAPPDKVVEAVNAGLERGSTVFGVNMKSLLCCMRDRPEWSLEVVQLCDEYRNQGVVGIDLAGDESLGKIPPNSDHSLAFKRARDLGIHRTVHAGEAGPAANVEEALDILHAERIGHGYHVLDDKRVYKRVIEEQIHLEVCPTSSFLTGAVEPQFVKHPVRGFSVDGVNFSVNTDGTSVIRTNLNKEFGLLKTKIGLNTAELTRATFNAARAAFITECEKSQLIGKLKDVYGIPK